MEVVMRTNIDINEELLQEAFSVSQVRSKKDLIHDALREYVRLKKRKDLTELAGTIEFYEGYNHKVLRKIKDDSC
jgi:Arc/MetJ family transcription regulator